MRCPDCNKFVGMDDSNEPEVEDVDVDDEGCVTAEVRIANCCSECGTELKEAQFSLEGQVPLATFRGHVCPDEKPEEGVEASESMPLLEADEETSERTSRTEGKGRGTRTYYGVDIVVRVKCGCGEKSEYVKMSDEVQASGMDELV